MARRENKDLKGAIFRVCGTMGRPSAPKLADALADAGLKHVPSDRQLQRYLAEWDALDERERAEYWLAHWPEVFEAGLLPWEASQYLAELEALYGKPTVRLARWYWRVVLSFPQVTDPTRRHFLAARLEQGEPGEAHLHWYREYPAGAEAERERTLHEEQLQIEAAFGVKLGWIGENE